jgi:3'(2'), 5'-bisphosphate nucleotidase
LIDDVLAALGTRDELSVGSVGVKVGLIARGARELYVNPESHCRLWDVCAPEAILTAAGGQLTDLRGAPISYDRTEDLHVRPGIIASNGACHAAVLARLGPLFAVL